MRFSFKTLFFILVLSSGFSGPGSQQKTNNPPEVRLSLSTKEKFLRWNSLVPYQIIVTDKEDGKSEYNEIDPNEVLLEIKFVSDSTMANEFVSGKETVSYEVPLRMGKALCFNCHGVKTKITGPSFQQIAQRYKRTPHAEDTLSARIIRGSTGIWSEVKMPPHPDLNKADVNKIVQWILQNGEDPNLNYFVGLQGAFRTNEKPSEPLSGGAYILTASYTDHGPEIRQGRDTIMLVVR